jgi:AcrR family transcriptional regulator
MAKRHTKRPVRSTAAAAEYPGAHQPKKTPKKRPSLGRTAWLESARQALIEEGTAGIEINKLAKRLGSSRSSFYWFFEDRAHLLNTLVTYWAESSNVALERVLNEHQHDGMAAYLAITNLWVDETEYNPKWDGAIRDWARTAETVRKVVEAVDQHRIALLEKLFQQLGYTGLDAHIRARVMYYHQVGYYAMGVRESRKERRALIPYYRRALTGRNR